MKSKLKYFMLFNLMFIFLTCMSVFAAGDGVVNTTVKDFRVNLDRTITDTSKPINVVVELLDENGQVDVFSESNVSYIYLSAASLIGDIEYSNVNDNVIGDPGSGDDNGTFATTTSAKIAFTNGRAGFHVKYSKTGTDTLMFYVVVVDTDGDTFTLGPKKFTITVNKSVNIATNLELIKMSPDNSSDEDNLEIDYTTQSATPDKQGQIDAGQAFTLEVKALNGSNYTTYQNSEVTVKFVPTTDITSDGNQATTDTTDCSKVVTVTGTMENGIAYIKVPAGTLTKAGKYDIYLSTDTTATTDGIAIQKSVKSIYVDPLEPVSISASLDDNSMYIGNPTSPTLTVFLLDKYGNYADSDKVKDDVQVSLSATNNLLFTGNTTYTLTIEAGDNKKTFSDFTLGTGSNAPTTDSTTGVGASTITISSASYDVSTSELTMNLYENKLVADNVSALTFTAGRVLDNVIRVGKDNGSGYDLTNVFTVEEGKNYDNVSSIKLYDNTVPTIYNDPDNDAYIDNSSSTSPFYYQVEFADNGSGDGMDVTLIKDYYTKQTVIATHLNWDNSSTNNCVVLDNVSGVKLSIMKICLDPNSQILHNGNLDNITFGFSTTLEGKKVKVTLDNTGESVTSMVGKDGLTSLKFATATSNAKVSVEYASDTNEKYMSTVLASGSTATVNAADAYTLKLYQYGVYNSCVGTGTPTQEISSIEITKSSSETIYGSQNSAIGDGNYYIAMEDAYGNSIKTGNIYWESVATSEVDPDEGTSGSFTLSSSQTFTYSSIGTDKIIFSTDTPGVNSAELNVTVSPAVSIKTIKVLPSSDYLLTNGEIPVVIQAYDEDGNLKSWTSGDFKILVDNPDMVRIRPDNRTDRDELENGSDLPSPSTTGEYILSLVAYNTTGDVTITVRNVTGDISGSATVHIVSSVNDIPSPVKSVKFDTPTLSMLPSKTAEANLQVLDADGKGIANKTCTLSSDAESVAKVDKNSVITGDNGIVKVSITSGEIIGSANITATCDGVSGNLVVNVTKEETTSCTADNLTACTDETSCTGVGGYWYDGVCNAEPQATSCTADNLTACTDETSCTDASGYWYDGVCNAEQKPEVKSAAPEKALEPSPTGPATMETVEASAGDTVSIKPQLTIASGDTPKNYYAAIVIGGVGYFYDGTKWTTDLVALDSAKVSVDGNVATFDLIDSVPLDSSLSGYSFDILFGYDTGDNFEGLKYNGYTLTIK